MEAYVVTVFEDVRLELNLVLLLSLVESDILKQRKIIDYEIENIKNIALEKLHRKRNFKEIFPLDLLKKQFPD